MAKIINIEKSSYLNETIEIYSGNKVGQYSKYLDKNPVFVTYYSVNRALTRTDVGSGGIQSELDKGSPIRYNKISNLPIYGVPQLKPDIQLDENGFDTNLDLSGLILLPGTVTPTEGDHIIISFPSSQEILIRVNNFEYNTIQSNDFYQIDTDLKDIGSDLEDKRLKYLIVESYQTIFENIGTQDKCFIRTDDVNKISTLAATFNDLRDMYYSTFFDKETGSFVLYDNAIETDYWYYDPYIEKFIMNNELYYEKNEEKSLILACNDLKNPRMNQMYRRTLLYAIETRNISYLNTFSYYYQRDIEKRLSPFVLNRIQCKCPEIIFKDKALLIEEGSANYLYPYDSINLISALKDSNIIFTTDNYLEEIIYHYMKNEKIEIDKSKIIQSTLTFDLNNYHNIPIIMYIILSYYNEYFIKTEL